ncbi:MAG: peptidylprolyl isomerase [Oscillospiraceae bacterium]|nr:peptidylprolyl isomerase [Oscillospiraceae bacterium]
MVDGSQFAAELYPHMTPNTVNNFLQLVNDGFYNGLTFHRIISGFMIQGGCPLGAGFGGPGYTIACETANNVPHAPGVLSMAHAGLNTGGSQFFIMHGYAPHLDGVHTAFGQVIVGLDVVNTIATTNNPNTIQSIVAHTHGVDFPAPVTGPAR